MNLYFSFRHLSTVWMAHTSELEGVNNMVHGIVTSGPTTSLALADALVANGKDCGLGSRGTALTK